MSVPELTRQALVLFVDGGHQAAEIMDNLEEQYLESIEDERRLDDGEFDDTAFPEGMNLRETSFGVIS